MRSISKNLTLRLLAFTLVLTVKGITSEVTAKNNPFDSLITQVHLNADGYLNFRKDTKSKSFSEAQKLYIESLANLLVGNYIPFESLNNTDGQPLDFQSDSILYSKFLLLQVEQSKLTASVKRGATLLYECLEVIKRQNNAFEYCKALLTAAEYYRTIEKFDFCETYLSKAAYHINQITDQNDRLYIEAKILNRKSAIHAQQNLLIDSVEMWSLKAINLAKQIEDLDLEAISSNELGFLYIEKNETKAEQYLTRAISIWEDIAFNHYAVNAKINLSRLYNKQRKYEKSLELLVKEIDQVEQSNWIRTKGYFFERLAATYIGLKDYKNAFDYMVKSKRHLLDSEEILYDKTVNLLTHQLELEQRNRDLKQKELMLSKANNQLNKEKDNYALLIIYIIILSLIGTTIFGFYLQAKKSKSLISQQRSLLESSNEKLEKALRQKDTLLQEVNHRVKNNLSFLTSLFYLQELRTDKKGVKKILRDSQLRIQTIALIHESLYQREDMEIVHFQDYLQNLIDAIKRLYWLEDKGITTNINCQNLNLKLKESIALAMIFNELLTNSFKHAFAEVDKPEIVIEYIDHRLTYFDNGPGMEKSVKPKSIGLKLIQILSNDLNATYHYDEKLNQFIIELNETKDA